MVPDDRRYTETHEWAMPVGDVIVVGITDFAVQHLTDLVYLELPEPGSDVRRGERFGEIESVKAVSDLNSPVSGEVIEVHEGLPDDLDRVAQDPYGEGWMIKVRPSDPSELEQLLDAEAYARRLEEQG